jgi:hypothetical protein
MSKDFYFPAGEMIIKDNKVHANPDRGVLRFFISKDTQLLSMKWENLDKKSSQEEIIITEGDWSYKKVSTQKGCPFYIQNTSYPDDKYYFYFQTKNKENIEKIEKSLEDILKTGKLPGAPESNETQNVPMSIEEMQNNQNMAQLNPLIKTFSEALRKLAEKKASLNDILKRETITKFFETLDEDTKKRLIQLLPENQRSEQGFYDNINSAQFRQGLGSLSYALDSENLPAVISSFGLDINVAQKYSDGVEAFVRSIIAKYEKKDEKKEEKKEENKEEKKEEIIKEKKEEEKKEQNNDNYNDEDDFLSFDDI